MKYDLYLVLGVCAPVVAFLLIFLIANVVGFLKEHWKKARLFIVVLIFDILLAATEMAAVSLLVEYIESGDLSRSIAIVIWLVLSVMLWLYIRVDILDEQLDKAQLGNVKKLPPDAAGVSSQSDKQALRDYLCEPVNDFPWLRVYTEEENRRGLLALRELAQRIRSKRGHYGGYLFHIFTAQRALGMGQYSLACHELFDVVEHYQNPETTALIYKMIEPYFDEVTPIEQAAKRKCCPHCGNQCRDEDRYCRFCGERLFKGFSELPEKEQGQIIAIVEQFTDAYLADKEEATHNEEGS